MKKVTGYIDVRALGCYDFEFYLEDNATEEEIARAVENICDYSINYDVEDGWEEYVRSETCYRRRKQ